MQALTIVVFQSDARIGQALATQLSRHFSAVHVTESLHELLTAVPRHRADVAILDIEGTQVAEVERLHREYPGLSIVCTHRVADEEMWASVLNAGASDMCPTYDTDGIVMSAVRQSPSAHAAA
jgi:DNA-binding NtrC family response regulator